MQGKLQEAIEQFERALEAQPDFAQAQPEPGDGAEAAGSRCARSSELRGARLPASQSRGWIRTM